MSTSKNGLDAFERSLRDSLEQFEVPYNSADWTQMERTLNGGGRAWWVSGVGLSILVAGLVVVGGGAWYAMNGSRLTTGETSDDKAVNEKAALNEGNSVVAQVTAESSTTPRSKNATTTTPSAKLEEEKQAVTPSRTDLTPAKETVGQVAATSSTEKRAKAEAASGVGTAPSTPAPNPNEITFKTSVAEGCPGTSIDFKVSNMPENGIYLWNFGDGSFSNKANPEHTFTKPGSYQVMLSMSAAGVGTIQNKPSSDVIVIHEAPMAAFNVLKQEYDGHLPSVHFENRSLAGEQYRWDFGDGQTSTIAHPDHIYKKKGVYQVELTVTNEIGCEDKIMKDVRIDKDYNLDAPASFSPNGDDFQEAFMPEALRTLGVKFMLTVYSPNGTLLYQTNDATKPWTGRPQNRGELCGAGEYVWVVDVRESLHLAETYTGKVKLER